MKKLFRRNKKCTPTPTYSRGSCWELREVFGDKTYNSTHIDHFNKGQTAVMGGSLPVKVLDFHITTETWYTVVNDGGTVSTVRESQLTYR